MVRRTLAVVLALFAFTAVPAYAGGPTSVVLSAPPHVTAFGYDDTQYAELQRLTDGAAGESGAHAIGRFVRATWLIHDMSVWRIDVIYPDAPGGPWILSENTLDGPTKPTWHRSTDPVQLLKLLSEFKLLTGEFVGGPTLADEQPTPTEPTLTQQEQAKASSPVGVFTGWRWIIPGLLLGAAGAAVALRLRRPD